jgi:hypothetical protein
MVLLSDSGKIVQTTRRELVRRAFGETFDTDAARNRRWQSRRKLTLSKSVKDMPEAKASGHWRGSSAFRQETCAQSCKTRAGSI